MEDREKTHRDQRALILTLTATALETAICAFLLLRIPADSKNAFLFGLSKERLLMLGLFVVVFFLNLLGLIFRNPLNDRIISQRPFGILCSAVTVIASFFVLLPDYRFGRIAAYYTRLRPFILLLFLISLTFSLYSSLVSDRFFGVRETLHHLFENKKFILCVLTVLAAGILFVEVTGIGKTTESDLWNKNGIPIQSLQLFVLLVIYHLMHKLGLFSFFSQHKKIPHFLIIWILAAVIWSQASIIPHFFAPTPMEPNLEYYPYSDAAIYDVSSQTALNGWGFHFGHHFLKPSVVYVSFLTHLASGNNVERSMLLQSALYGILPAIIFLFGSSLGGTGCGYMAAMLSILKEWNALNSRSVSTVHSRLIMSEFLTQILLAAFCYAVFHWIKRKGREGLYAAIAGGTLSLGIFTRFNFAAFLPAGILILVIAYRKNFRAFMKPLMIFVLTAILTAAPILIRDSVKSRGSLYYLNDTIQRVLIGQRFNIKEEKDDNEVGVTPSETITEKETTSDATVDLSDAASGAEIINTAVSEETSVNPGNEKEKINTGQITQKLTNKNSNKYLTLFKSMLNHGMHNFISEALTLPMELTFHNLEHLYKQDGDGLWRDDWKGEFSVRQWIYIGIWILLGAVTIGCLIRQEGLAGFSILYFWLVYAFSIGFSRSSGGRYIVPCNWIPTLLLAYLCAIIFNKGKIFDFPAIQISQKVSVFQTVGTVFAFTAFFTSLLLFEKFMPSKITSAPEGDLSILQERLAGRDDIDWDLVQEQIKNKQMNLTHGVAIYPRYYYYRQGEHTDSGALMKKDYSRMTFTGINGEKGSPRIQQEYLLPHTSMITDFPQDSVFRALSCKSGMAYETVLAITIETPDGQVFTYVSDPEREFSCPVAEPVCYSIDNCY